MSGLKLFTKKYRTYKVIVVGGSGIELGKFLGYTMPQLVTVYAIEVKDHTSFGENCTVEIEERVPAIAREIINAEML